MLASINSLSFLFALALVASASALECFECYGLSSCNGADQNRTVQCDRSRAQATIESLKVVYPEVETSLVPSDSFVCIRVKLTLEGQSTESFKSRGCVFNAKGNVCDQKTISFNGALECYSCNQDKCNAAAGLTWSVLMLVAGWIATHLW